MKDEVKEVREGFECGMAFENYDDIKENDVIECFEIEEVARQL
jgi:translation initiation factor IF-2